MPAERGRHRIAVGVSRGGRERLGTSQRREGIAPRRDRDVGNDGWRRGTLVSTARQGKPGDREGANEPDGTHTGRLLEGRFHIAHLKSVASPQRSLSVPWPR